MRTLAENLAVAKTIKQQIIAGAGLIRVWSWGAGKWQCISEKEGGLAFRVTGRKFCGRVKVVLNSLDEYEVTLEGWDKEAHKRNVIEFSAFCDNLGELIDEKVERVPEYAF